MERGQMPRGAVVAALLDCALEFARVAEAALLNRVERR